MRPHAAGTAPFARHTHLAELEADFGEQLIGWQCNAVDDGEVAAAANGDVLILLVRIQHGGRELVVQDLFVCVAAAVAVAAFEWHP